jgi:hypothetical protein
MAAGSDTYKGLAVPLTGDSLITQRTAATDVLTIQGASAQSGDFLVCRDSSSTEYFYVTSAGLGVFVGGVATKDFGTTAPTTLTMTVNGGLGVANVSGTVRLYSRQNGTIYYTDVDG